ncbi:hypothetical protein [Actinoplanes sp. L3-i22]|uniref:hypothetical protein n=1 Tax=Actinoplanes sp. L3-i22 TaxID=2836373 RepID=UPI001C7923D1|nr:hypothetical protein [Actinoplanes sp. L3-i22]BCY05205.1 hypothetical protein L3i22_002930 [Actinoplanes sp. L3-i22]
MALGERNRRVVIVGWGLTGLGLLITVVWFGLVGVAYAGSYRAEQALRAGPAFLNGGVRDHARTCAMTSADGPERQVRVPAMPKRGVHLSGVRVDVPSAGSRITCDGAVHVTQGFPARLLVIAEQWAVLFCGLAVGAVGLHRLGLFRNVSRYP